MEGRWLLILDTERERDVLIETVAQSIASLKSAPRVAIREIAVVEPAPEATLSLLVRSTSAMPISKNDVLDLIASHAPDADLNQIRVVAQ